MHHLSTVPSPSKYAAELFGPLRHAWLNGTGRRAPPEYPLYRRDMTRASLPKHIPARCYLLIVCVSLSKSSRAAMISASLYPCQPLSPVACFRIISASFEVASSFSFVTLLDVGKGPSSLFSSLEGLPLSPPSNGNNFLVDCQTC